MDNSTSPSAGMHILLNGRRIDARAARERPMEFRVDLAAVRATHGHALCECSAPSLKLVIRQLERGPILAAWPTTAALHHPLCPFFHELEAYSPTPVGIAETPEGRAVAPTRLPPWELLHLLWSRSALNQWRFGWTRDWSRARGWLLATAKHVSVEGAPLDSMLYIPPRFSRPRRREIDAQWQAFTAHIGTRQGYVLGIARGVTRMPWGWRGQLRHHSAGFDIADDLAASLASSSRRGWSQLVGEKQDPDLRVIVLAGVNSTQEGGIIVREAALMLVSHDLVPVAGRWEATAVQMAIESGRDFTRPLGFAQEQVDLPALVLKDTVPQCEIYVRKPGTNPTVHSRRLSDWEHGAHFRAAAVHVWDAGSHPRGPALPPGPARGESQGR